MLMKPNIMVTVGNLMRGLRHGICGVCAWLRFRLLWMWPCECHRDLVLAAIVGFRKIRSTPTYDDGDGVPNKLTGGNGKEHGAHIKLVISPAAQRPA